MNVNVIGVLFYLSYDSLVDLNLLHRKRHHLQRLSQPDYESLRELYQHHRQHSQQLLLQYFQQLLLQHFQQLLFIAYV